VVVVMSWVCVLLGVSSYTDIHSIFLHAVVLVVSWVVLWIFVVSYCVSVMLFVLPGGLLCLCYLC